MSVEARLDMSEGVSTGKSNEIRCDIAFDTFRQKDRWMIARVNGSWNGKKIQISEPFAAGVDNPAKAAIAMLLPYAIEKPDFSDLPQQPGSHPVPEAFVNEVLRQHGFAPEQMSAKGTWTRSAEESIFELKGKGKDQYLNYSMKLTETTRQVEFDFSITVKLPENDPFAAGLEMKKSGKGRISVRHRDR